MNVIRALHLGLSANEKTSKLEVLTDQLIDSLIVGGIAFFSTLIVNNGIPNYGASAIAFGIAFLIKMKEYRNIKN